MKLNFLHVHPLQSDPILLNSQGKISVLSLVCILVRVLQKNRTDKRYIFVSMYLYLGIYYKGLTHMIMVLRGLKVCRLEA